MITAAGNKIEGKTPGAKTVSRRATQHPDSQIERDSPSWRPPEYPISYRNGKLGLRKRKLSAIGLCDNNFGTVLPRIPRSTPQYLDHEAWSDLDYFIIDSWELPYACKGTT